MNGMILQQAEHEVQRVQANREEIEQMLLQITKNVL
jgi:hypothetical protein